MAVLNAAQRNALPDSAFAGPDRSYPVNDASHARNALARVSQAQHSGRISDKFAAIIKKKAKKKLGEPEGDEPGMGAKRAAMNDNDGDE